MFHLLHLVSSSFVGNDLNWTELFWPHLAPRIDILWYCTCNHRWAYQIVVWGKFSN